MVDPSQQVEVRRSARRRRTVSAYRDGNTIVVLMPARTTRSDERRLVTEMVELVTRREANRSRIRSGDTGLLRRSAELSARYLDGRAEPLSVRWVGNMRSRWGSCTIADRTIRLSQRLQSMPDWVIDYVLLHELTHLLEPGHGPEFWRWVNRYPRTERARGYLEGVAVAAQLPGLSCESSFSEPEVGPFEVELPGFDPVGAELGRSGVEDSGASPEDSTSGALFELGLLVPSGPSPARTSPSGPAPVRSKSARSGTDSSGAFP
jgi:hypothetical protein